MGKYQFTRFYTITGNVAVAANPQQPFDPKRILESLSRFGQVDEFYFSRESEPTTVGNTTRYTYKGEIIFSSSWTWDQQERMLKNLPLFPAADIVMFVRKRSGRSDEYEFSLNKTCPNLASHPAACPPAKTAAAADPVAALAAAAAHADATAAAATASNAAATAADAAATAANAAATAANAAATAAITAAAAADAAATAAHAAAANAAANAAATAANAVATAADAAADNDTVQMFVNVGKKRKFVK